MADLAPQLRAPEAESRLSNRANVYYPQARVTLSVVFETFGEPQSPKTFPVTPRSITIYSNSYKEADTWSVEFDAQDLPFSPDLIRAGACEIYLFQTAGIGQLPEVIRAKDDPKTAKLEGLEPSIVGLFDEASLSMDESGRAVTIDGTDYTSLFIAKPWNSKTSGKKGRVPSGKSLDRVLQDLMNQVESASVMTLDVRPAKTVLPTVGSAEARANKKGLPGRGSYWDVMVDLALRYGFVLYIEGLRVVLVELASFVQEKRETVRKMVWGRNLTSLRMSRRIGKEQVPVIEVRSYDDKKRKVVKARFPTSKKTTDTNPSHWTRHQNQRNQNRLHSRRSLTKATRTSRQTVLSLALASRAAHRNCHHGFARHRRQRPHRVTHRRCFGHRI